MWNANLLWEKFIDSNVKRSDMCTRNNQCAVVVKAII